MTGSACKNVLNQKLHVGDQVYWVVISENVELFLISSYDKLEIQQQNIYNKYIIDLRNVQYNLITDYRRGWG